MMGSNLVAEVFNLGPRLDQAAETRQLEQQLPAGYRCRCVDCLDIDRWAGLVLGRQEAGA